MTTQETALSLEALKILVDARALIADKKRWTQGRHAVNRDGRACDAHSAEAVAWCALGATWAAAVRAELIEHESDADDALAVAAYKRGRGISGINDGLGHKEVLAMFDRAIAEGGAQ